MKKLVNYIKNEYQTGEWTRVFEGPMFVSTLIVSNNNEEEEAEVSIRLGDHYGNTIMMIEPKLIVAPLSADNLTVSSLPIMKNQFLEYRCSVDGLHFMVSGAAYNE